MADPLSNGLEGGPGQVEHLRGRAMVAPRVGHHGVSEGVWMGVGTLDGRPLKDASTQSPWAQTIDPGWSVTGAVCSSNGSDRAGRGRQTTQGRPNVTF